MKFTCVCRDFQTLFNKLGIPNNSVHVYTTHYKILPTALRGVSQLLLLILMYLREITGIFSNICGHMPIFL